MAEATASASDGSSGSPLAIVASSWRKTAFGRRWRWTATEKTFSPYRLALGCVRSAWPRAPPLGLHWAAATFGVRVRDGISGGILLRIETAGLNVGGRAARLFVHMSKETAFRFDSGDARPREAEHATAALARLDPDPPARGIDDFLGDRQPDPGPGILLAGRRAGEHAEDPLGVGRGDADPVVGDL